MKETMKITCVLTLVCATCAFFLALVYAVTSSKIEINADDFQQRSVMNLAPLTAKFETIQIDGEEILKLFDSKDLFIGYAFFAEGSGYQDNIKILGVTDTDFKLLKGIEILESSETPGLGAKIKEDFFKEQFIDKPANQEMICIKTAASEDNQIQAITAATVSSKAVVDILNQRIKRLRTQLNK